MALLHVESLPPRTNAGMLLAWLCQIGEIDGKKIGKIEVRGRAATIEVPESWAARLARKLDGEKLNERHVRVSLQAERNPDATGTGDHFQQLMDCIELEAEAELRQTLQDRQRLSPAAAERAGLSLTGLVLRDETTGLGGRSLLTLGKRDERQALPFTRLNAGAPVLLSEEGASDESARRGVVCQRQDATIEVAFESRPDLDDARRLRLDASNDEIARRRQHAALARTQVAAHDRLADLRDVLLARRLPEFTADAAPPTWLNRGLDESQQAAIQFALGARDVAVIHGPPGTGKTTAVVELIRQAVCRGEKVLACAPSNLAVDNLLERLVLAGERAVRVGHPARVLPELRERTLDLLVERHPQVRQARKLVREAYALRNKAAKFTRAAPPPGARREMRDEAQALLADARRWEAQVVDNLLDTADVLCATTTALDSEILGRREFDLVVIDEACQATEPECWIPLLRSRRVVLAGDHCQLSPTIVSPEAARRGLGVSLLERLMQKDAAAIARRLTVQYRMHHEIMQFSSNEFYDGELTAAPTVAEHRLCDLPQVERIELTETAVRFVDTAGAGFDEEVEPDGTSRFNPAEARWVATQVQALLDVGVETSKIAVIAPYAAQVRLLRDLLPAGLEIDTVDGFQGREKEAVVLTLVRSNAEGEIGFLADVRRMNVALTRARRKLLIIGDSATIAAHEFYQRLLDYLTSIGAYHTIWEEPGGD